MDDPPDREGDDGELGRRAHARDGDRAGTAQVGEGGDGRRDGEQDGQYGPEGEVDRQQHAATLARGADGAGASEPLM
ncbi:hypothetical protein QFZ82_005540 [Streptomyces sp. V4I23]|nr:hypothetical protein [Streptomyces sp. V4I23]